VSLGLRTSSDGTEVRCRNPGLALAGLGACRGGTDMPSREDCMNPKPRPFKNLIKRIQAVGAANFLEAAAIQDGHTLRTSSAFE
jgi:hypothetical protein